MVDCLSWHSCYGRSSRLYSKEKRFRSKKHVDQQDYIQDQVDNNTKTKSKHNVGFVLFSIGTTNYNCLKFFQYFIFLTKRPEIYFMYLHNYDRS